MENAWGLLRAVPVRTRPYSPIDRKSSTQLDRPGPNPLDGGLIAHVIENIGDPIRQLLHLRLLEAAGGDRRRADAQSAGYGRGPWIVGHRVLVDRHMGAAQGRIRILAGDVLIDQIEQKQMFVGAAADDLAAGLLQNP